jgi:hypothetical protein
MMNMEPTNSLMLDSITATKLEGRVSDLRVFLGDTGDFVSNMP